MRDLNKTEITHDLTTAALVWMYERGFKPLQTEVRVKDGWVADIAGVIKPTQTEILDLKLIERAPKWTIETQELVCDWVARVKAMKQVPYTGLVEVKTSRSDFTRDRKWEMAQPVNLAYLAVPKGLISEDEWPAGWGILEFSEGSIRVRRPASIATIPPELQRDVVFEISIRLENTTDPSTISQRSELREQGDRMKAKRLSEIIDGVCDIVESNRDDFGLALAFSKLQGAKLTTQEKERLYRLFGLGKDVKSKEPATFWKKEHYGEIRS
jgi:hypothetical protein